MNGSSTAIPMLASVNIQVVCLITNNGNATLTLDSVHGYINHPVDPQTYHDLTGTIPPGDTASFLIYSGPASNATGYDCGGGISYSPASDTNGGGIGGAIVPVAGTITTSPLTIAPGESVAIAGSGIVLPITTEFPVTVNGVEVPGSPMVLDAIAGTFGMSVPFPNAGTYKLALTTEFNGRTITYAVWDVTVVAALPDTGARSVPLAALAGALVAAGAALLIYRRNRSLG